VQGEPYVFLNTNTHGRNVWEAGDRPILTRMAHIQGAAVEAPPESLASLADRGLVLLRFRVSPRVLERRLAAFLAPPGLDEPAAELLVPSAPPAAAPAAYAAAAAARAARPAAIGRLAVQLEGEAELHHFCNYDGGMNVSWAPELETARLPEPQALVVVSPEAYLTCNNGLQNDSSIFPYSAGGKASGGGYVDADENRRSLYPSYEHAQPRLEARSRNGRLDLAMVDARRARWEPAPFSWDEDLQECVPCPGRTPACVYTMGQFCTFYLGMNYDQAARDCKVTGFQAFLEFFLAPSVLRSIRVSFADEGRFLTVDAAGVARFEGAEWPEPTPYSTPAGSAGGDRLLICHVDERVGGAVALTGDPACPGETRHIMPNPAVALPPAAEPPPGVLLLRTDEDMAFAAVEPGFGGAPGHLAVLEWLRAQEPTCEWDSFACDAAAKGAHMEALQWLRALDPPCEWGEFTCAIHLRRRRRRRPSRIPRRACNSRGCGCAASASTRRTAVSCPASGASNGPMPRRSAAGPSRPAD